MKTFLLFCALAAVAQAQLSVSPSGSVSDTAYGPTWDGSLTGASKNAIYDKIQTIVAGSGDVSTDTIFDAKGDLVVGTGADTAIKLTVGANDTMAMAASGQASGLKWATPTEVRTALALTIGTNVQAYDADLTTWAGVTPGAGVATFLATPSSANFRGTLTDESGTGVFLTVNGVGGALTLDASGFNGQLTTTDDTLQEVAQKLDDLTGAGGDATLAGTQTFTGDKTFTGVVDMGAATVTLPPLSTGLVLEGATADASETTIAAVDPTADRTFSIPNKTGTAALQGITTVNKAANYTIGTDDPDEIYGGVIYVTGAATITVPAVVARGAFTVITVGAVAVSVDPNASDLIVLDGTALSDGDKVTNTSTTGDMLVCTYYDATGWYCASGSNDGDPWTDTN